MENRWGDDYFDLLEALNEGWPVVDLDMSGQHAVWNGHDWVEIAFLATPEIAREVIRLVRQCQEAESLREENARLKKAIQEHEVMTRAGVRMGLFQGTTSHDEWLWSHVEMRHDAVEVDDR